MTANTQPIFTKVVNNSFGQVTTADAVSDGTSANDVLIFSAGADGSFLTEIVLTPRSTSGSTTTSAAAARIYLNNGTTVGTASNNVLIRELSLPACTVGVTQTTGVTSFKIPINNQIKASYKIYIGITAIAANTQWAVAAFGGDY